MDQDQNMNQNISLSERFDEEMMVENIQESLAVEESEGIGLEKETCCITHPDERIKKPKR